MLKVMMEGRILYVLMGIMAAAGIWSKIVVNVSLGRLLRGAGNMNKSSHPLMRLVKAKFEHACMVSDTVENVGVFVEKYLYEYRVLGLRLHTLRRMEKICALGCLILGALGMAGWYALEGMGDAALRTGAGGAVLAILVYLFHLTTDESYRLQAARNYMVDYLQNVCRRKYEKAAQKELKVMTPEAHPAEEAGSLPVMMIKKKEEPDQEKESIDADRQDAPEARPASSGVQKIRREEKEEQEKKEDKTAGEDRPLDKDVLIRRILEEYMA